MKKIIAVLLCGIMSMAGLGACSNNQDNPAKDDTDSGVQVVTTIFPIYDWTRNVAGDNGNAKVSMLIDTGVDLHSFQPSAEDVMKISMCDVFIYVGGESDKWVADALAEAVNPDMVTVNLMEVMGDKAVEEEIKEGMQEEEEEEEEHEEEGPEYDEHVWLSLNNAEFFTDKIAEALTAADPENADSYRSNADAYISQLKELDAKYEEAVTGAATKVLLFGDRFPFRYMTDDYGLDYYAAFVGCSAETEASFETLVFLSGKVDELGLKNVITIEGRDHRIAESIVGSTSEKNQQILTLDSMQSTTASDAASGATYLSIMEKNLEVLKEALK